MRTLASLIAAYLETGEYEKQLSPDTIKAYRIDLLQFLDFTEGAWADKVTLDQYIKYLNQHFSPRSVKRKLASVRAFYHEMEISGELDENPFNKLHVRIHAPQQLPHRNCSNSFKRTTMHFPMRSRSKGLFYSTGGDVRFVHSRSGELSTNIFGKLMTQAI